MASCGLHCFALVLLCLFAFTTQAQLVNVTQSVIGTAGGNKIWYQADSTEYLSWGNIKNPVQISIIYNSGSLVTNATVCVNSFAKTFPISGVNLNSTCPSGGIGLVTNYSQIVLSPPDTIMDDSENITGPATIVASVYVKPTTEGGFVVVIPENNVTQTFEVTLQAQACNDSTEYPIGIGEDVCVAIPHIEENSEREIYLTAGAWQYFQLDTSVLTNYTNALYAYTNNSASIKIYTQSGYYPTKSWYIPTVDEVISDTYGRSTILTPGVFSQGETFFFGLYNFGTSSEAITFNITTSACSSFSIFGNDCSHTTYNNLDASDGVFVISSTLSSPNITNPTTNNVGSAFSFKYESDSFENNYAYFALDEYPEYPTPYYIRVSTANNDVSDSSGAPSIFAKKGGYPSAQSNHYDVSSIGDVTHQIVIRIDENDVSTQNTSSETWYFAVPLPADFSIWVGANCAGNCENQAFGVCMCDSVTCQNVTSNFTNPAAFYVRPRSLLDSGGACNCIDEDYSSSFNCTEVVYQNFWIWITFISIVAALLFLIAIGVPLLCWFTNRRKSTFEEM